MKRFSDLKIPSADGKKMFDCKTVSITDIVNCEIEVHDFEGDIKTQHGNDRMIVKIRINGEDAKIFTNCQQIKNVLNMSRPEDLPFTTTIRKIKSGNNASYKFT